MREIVYSLEEIEGAARQFAESMGERSVFAFYGSMGAGKTTFIRALAGVLGVKGDAVNSPTFSIVNEYQAGRGTVYHFDFYRINTPQEAVDFGLYDYLDSGSVCLMEWPELVEGLLPEDTVRVEIEELADGRRAVRF